MAERISLPVEIYEQALNDGGTVFVAECRDLDIASQGATVEEALQNIQEAVDLWMETASKNEIDNRLFAMRRRRGRTLTTNIEVGYGQAARTVGQ